MLNKIDDLSYSNIVDLVQGEEIVGADLINNLALELEELKQERAELANQLHCLDVRMGMILNGCQHVANHLKKRLPLIVIRQSYVIEFSDKNIEIKKNVI